MNAGEKRQGLAQRIMEPQDPDVTFSREQVVHLLRHLGFKNVTSHTERFRARYECGAKGKGRVAQRDIWEHPELEGITVDVPREGKLTHSQVAGVRAVLQGMDRVGTLQDRLANGGHLSLVNESPASGLPGF